MPRIKQKKRIKRIKWKKRLSLPEALLLCVLLCLPVLSSGCGAKPSQEYGVFLGIGGEEAERLQDYRMVVIEPSEFREEQLRELHEAGKTVYGYLNIGALEEYRPYYNRFRDMTLGVYEDWPDERWADVSRPEWQRFVAGELGGQYAEMGFDGLFLDNADVYYHYPADSTFQGLCAILQELKVYDIPLLINGGDTFVKRCMDEGSALSLFEGINQESVFTGINFADGSCIRQQEAETLYFKDYLARAKDCGLSVYLLEYGAAPALAGEIESYCRENGFLWYNAEGPALR
ncbi:endo alpha-1,4 polygalactosaminidase [Lachnoclostridium sp. Marseille-P6806]|uniref:endo alpha-1,4 polygalactosaminidase n=1 Tax=Lachnoclostridium sp. Marseille-P6806 TaxID=2364793 RepID=UPI001F5F9AD3|nr:endo alpha-1,4 polygalactosaminidase [Lachnoclostridium sp. Marseille-P6806]